MESPDSLERMTEKVRQLAEEKLAEGFRVGIICTDESRQTYPKGLVRSIGSRTRRETVAHNLYALLREFDDLKADYIFSESFPANIRRIGPESEESTGLFFGSSSFFGAFSAVFLKIWLL